MTATQRVPTAAPKVLDLRCYLVTSGTGRRTVEAAAAAAAGGAGMIQVRAKDASTAELLELTCTLAAARPPARPAPPGG
ncbi:MAG: hypothetical protein ACTH8W_10665, partial [Brachybacterium tyrofermentans]